MPKAPVTKDDLDAFLRDIDVRIQRMERHTHNFSPPARPGPAPAPPYVAPLPPVCDFFDDFERADGPLGPNWLRCVPYSPTGVGGYADFYIDSGAAVAPMDMGFGTRQYWHEPLGADQSIEIVVDNVGGNNAYFQLLTNCNTTNRACQGLEVNFYDRDFPWHGPPPGEGDTLNINLFRMSAGNIYTWQDWYQTEPYPAGPVRLRLESDADGTQRCYVNGELVLTGVDPAPNTGSYVGMMMDPGSFMGAYTSPRILSACINSTGDICLAFDDFERADGPLGAPWVVGPGAWGDDPYSPLTIIEGAAEDGNAPGVNDALSTMMYYSVAQGADQSIEVLVERLWQEEPVDTGTGHYLTLSTNVTGNGHEQQFADFNFGVDFSGISIVTMHMQPDGNTAEHAEVDVPMSSFPASMRVKMETTAAGVVTISIDGSTVLTYADPNFVPGQFCAMGTASGKHLGTYLDFVPGVRFQEVCINSAEAP